MKINPVFVKPKEITGNNLVFLNATVADAAFILELRTDTDKSKYISKTQPDINQQISWLERYSNDESQAYFIIQNKDKENIGTVRLYDPQDESFCWGSWIVKAGCPASFSIESALIVYHFALSLGFRSAHFEVRKGNCSVWKFHERFGAVRVRESVDDYFYTIGLEAIKGSLKRYGQFLPHGISLSKTEGREKHE